MSANLSDRHLLYGLLALQNNFISRDQLVSAFGIWIGDKARPLDEILREQKALDGPTRDLLSALVERHLVLHDNNPEKSLAAISSIASARQELEQLGDEQLQASLLHVNLLPSRNTGEGPRATGAMPGDRSLVDDPDATCTTTVGEFSIPGQRFRILRPHAKGGLGRVSVALDSELHREVALKEIQEKNADHPEVRARFLREAEITGGLEHPGIVPVYGLGTYADGRPFYAMKFVKGDSLKTAIGAYHHRSKKQKKTAQERAELNVELRNLLGRFIDVCNAMQYAHDRGVLHRDLKPGNIMLGKYGETLVVDWGLAKARGAPERATSQDFSEQPLRLSAVGSGSTETLDGNALGTPQYMSPEQACGQLQELSPASDVYSLGATLYHLLTGSLPVPAIETAAVLERVRRGDIPPPRSLDPSIPRTLEAVCQRAMALSPSDRYATPSQLADELERWLADEPIATYSEPLLARGRRWLRKHPKSVTAVVATLLAGLAGLSTVAAVVSRKNQELTESRGQAEAVSTFLIQVLESPDPKRAGRQITIAEVLDRASDKLKGEFTANPLTRSALLDAIGRSFVGLGLFPEALPLLNEACQLRRASLGPEHPFTLVSMNNLATAYGSAGQVDEALVLLEQAVKLMQARLGDEDHNTLDAMNNLAATYASVGDLDKALALYDQTLKLRQATLGAEHPGTLTTMNGLATAYEATGRLDQAIPLFERTLQLRQANLAAEHPDTLYSMYNLACAYASKGRLDDAQPLYEQALKSMQEKLGPENPYTLKTMNNLAFNYQSAGRFEDAVPLMERTLELMRSKLGPKHLDTLNALNNLAEAYGAAGRRDEALPLYRQTLKLKKENLGDTNPSTLYTAISLGKTLLTDREFAEAESLLLPAYEGLHEQDGKLPIVYRQKADEALECLVRLYEAWGKPEQAEQWRGQLNVHQQQQDK